MSYDKKKLTDSIIVLAVNELFIKNNYYFDL